MKTLFILLSLLLSIPLTAQVAATYELTLEGAHEIMAKAKAYAQ